MKLIFGTALALFVAKVSFGQSIAGSKHDFSNIAYYTWNLYDYDLRDGTGRGNSQICQPCHTPHNASTVADERPLWNHTMSSAVYTMYSNAPTFQATIDAAPSGKSKLCLSCHDGTIALDNFNNLSSWAGFGMDPGNTGVTMATFAPNVNFGSDLSNDHPISMVFDAALVTLDGGLFDPTTTLSGITPTGTIATDMLDASSKVQCTSCHNPHNSTNGKFLKKSNTGSALCLTCHDK